MPNVPFAHLHLHTQYSLLDGAIKHNPLFERVKAIGQEAIAMTDHGNLFGVVEFYEKARANKVKPIIGCETYIAAGSRFAKEKRLHDDSGHDAISHQLLLAMNATGYKNLMMLASKAYLEGFYYKPRIDLELLAQHNEGLITTSGCLSSLVCRHILRGETNEAWELVENMSRQFKGRYYLELQRHGIADQDKVNQELLKMHSDLNLPLLATNDAHYLEAEDHAHHDALLCIGTAASINDEKRFKFDGGGFFVKSGAEMLEVFGDLPKAVSNSMEISERCNVELEMGDYHMPEYQVPAGKTRDQVLQQNAWRGLRERLKLEPDQPFENGNALYKKRMEHELKVITQMGFAGYFLIVADFINYAKQNGIPVGPGRGSAAGSLAAYGLGITGVDPIEYDIIFERFLNPERVSMPDIDVDLCMRGRAQVIDYVAKKYDDESGGDQGRRVAQIITFGTLQARAALRDVGRVMDMSYGDVDRIVKLIPQVLNITLEEAVAQTPELQARINKDPNVQKLFETARKLEGLTRHASTHAAGLVIGTKPLIEQVPLYRDKGQGDLLVQFDMNCVEKLGLIKFDFLGLRTLTAIADAERNIRESTGAGFSIDEIPMDDKDAYQLLSRGATKGIFQMESPGMTDLVTKLKPRKLKEIIPLIALYRPGPLNSGLTEDYEARKNKRKPVQYMLPELKPILEETLGVIVYQDQVLQIANRLAGYSLGEADLLRRAMGKKKPEEMAKHEGQFVAGCAQKGINQNKARALFKQIEKFAEYAFAKAHSTAYAFLVYQTAYLKARHPREYFAALLSVEAGNSTKVAGYIAALKQDGVKVLPPDANESSRDFTPVERGIRFGFAGVKNVGEKAVQKILEAREQGGAFKNVFDFAARTSDKSVTKKVMEALVKCGAFDSLHQNRAALYRGINAALQHGKSAQEDLEIGQEGLFGGGKNAPALAPELPATKAWSTGERLGYEKEILGFYVTGHPLQAHEAKLRRAAALGAADAEKVRDGREVTVGGLVVSVREKSTRTGGVMAFATLEDFEGEWELILHASTYEKYREPVLQAHHSVNDPKREALPLVLRGRGEVREKESEGTVRIIVQEVHTLQQAQSRQAKRVEVRVAENEAGRETLLALHKLLRAHPGRCPVALHIVIPNQSETELDLPDHKVEAGDELLQKINALFGRTAAAILW